MYKAVCDPLGRHVPTSVSNQAVRFVSTLTKNPLRVCIRGASKLIGSSRLKHHDGGKPVASPASALAFVTGKRQLCVRLMLELSPQSSKL